MGKFKIYDNSIPREQLAAEREARYIALSPKEKWNQLFSLINTSIVLNGGHPLKQPQGKGLLISRKK